MRLVVDVRMPPALADGLRRHGHEAQHWSALGGSGALDAEILGYCRVHRALLIKLDLDFGDLLAASGAALPSIIIVREQSTDPLTSRPSCLTPSIGSRRSWSKAASSP